MTTHGEDAPRDLAGQRVLVLGLGMSGTSAAAFCADRGAHVVAADERPPEQLADLAALPPGVDVVTGRALPDSHDFDLVVPSPGVPAERYRAGARRVWGDIELAWRHLDVPIVAVTGTNGKSTTVRLIEALLRAAGLRARAAGNVGTPVLSLVGEPLDVAVLEVSSFQLETTDAFRPRVAVVLNVSPDHLDRHGDIDHYAAAKQRILASQTPDDRAVLMFDDAVVRAFAQATRAEVIPVSLRQPMLDGYERAAWLDAGALVLRSPDAGAGRAAHTLERFPLEAPLPGRHNLENTVMALTAVWALDVDLSAALPGLIGFEGLPHRCERIGVVDRVTWIDDSKATNVGAAVRSLESFDRPVLWIAGGSDKGGDFDALAEVAARRARRALLIGETAPAIAAALEGRIPTELCPDLDTAVARAAANATPGDVVLLAPACASLDQFASFEERGQRFRSAVLRLGPALERGGASA